MTLPHGDGSAFPDLRFGHQQGATRNAALLILVVLVLAAAATVLDRENRPQEILHNLAIYAALGMLAEGGLWLVSSSRLFWLEITADGIVEHYGPRRLAFAWSEIEDIQLVWTTVGGSGKTMVRERTLGFALTPGKKRPWWAKGSPNPKLDVILGKGYGDSPEEVLEAARAYWQHARGATTPA